MQSSVDMVLMPTGMASVVEVTDGTNHLTDLPLKDFRKYVQRVWNAFDLIKGWTGDLPDMEHLATLITEGHYNKLPAPFGLKTPAPVKNMHLIVVPSMETPGTYDIVKYMTFGHSIGYKALGALVYGQAKQFDAPETGARSKGSRVALHRLFMSINGTHITSFTTQEVPEGDKDHEPKKKLTSDEDIDAAFDLIREAARRRTKADIPLLFS